MLKFRFVTLLIFLMTLALSVYLFVIIPKGFFPQQDTGLITGITESGQDVSIAEMMRHQDELGAIVQKDPAVAHVAMAIGGTGYALNNGRMFITLKPRDQRDASGYFSANQHPGRVSDLAIHRPVDAGNGTARQHL